MNTKITFVTNINDISSEQWNKLAANQYPFLQHAFLAALESSGSVTTETGWQPFHLIATNSDTEQLMAAMPLYIKTHSYGEYIFDWAWADAYQRHGFRYYPKLLSAIPFTPVTGPRLLVAEPSNCPELTTEIFGRLKDTCIKTGLSSCHVLYPDTSSIQDISKDWLQRHSVQFQWHNKGYADFQDFLAGFSSRKRKNVKKERDKITKQHIQINRLTGDDISEGDMQFFYSCYRETYLKRSGHGGYINEDCFLGWWRSMKNNMMLVRATLQGHPVAAALYFFDANGLYGRYWGALKDIDGLHFECCYYQGIEFCIEHHLPLFNPGTQGEHKIQRGFEPITCHSWHWIAEPAFQHAIANFTKEEQLQLSHYKQQAKQLLPFKQSD
ncbi:MAG: GNAT family N-acetyltransferase [Aestuariibacter sp.]